MRNHIGRVAPRGGVGLAKWSCKKAAATSLGGWYRPYRGGRVPGRLGSPAARGGPGLAGPDITFQVRHSAGRRPAFGFGHMCASWRLAEGLRDRVASSAIHATASPPSPIDHHSDTLPSSAIAEPEGSPPSGRPRGAGSLRLPSRERDTTRY